MLLFTFPGVQINGESMEVWTASCLPRQMTLAGSESAVVDMTGASFDFTQGVALIPMPLEVQVLAVSGEVTAPNGIYMVTRRTALS